MGACSPTDFIVRLQLTMLFFGITCDHSLGWSRLTSVYKVYNEFIDQEGAPRGLEKSKSAQNRQSFPLDVRKLAPNNKQTEAKDAQKDFGSVLDLCQ